jgi:hypothetical protein
LFCETMRWMCSLMPPPVYLSDTKCLIRWVAYVFEEPVYWFFIFERYSETVAQSVIEPMMEGSIVFFTTAKHFLLAGYHLV